MGPRPRPSFYYTNAEGRTKNENRAVLLIVLILFCALIFSVFHKSFKSHREDQSKNNVISEKWWDIKPEADSQHSDSQKNDYKNKRYGIIIDSGSSQSRLMIYSWNDTRILNAPKNDSIDLNAFPNIEFGIDNTEETYSSRIAPGISDYGTKISKLGQDHINPMLEFAKKTIPKHKHKQTPIYLMATAGMRLLEKSVQDDLLYQACKYIKKNSNFYVGSCRSHFKVITGEEEGVYGWVSVNYLKNGFKLLLENKNQPKPKKNIENSTNNDEHPTTTNMNVTLSKRLDSKNKKANTFGFLDMGGASTQIAFELTPEAALKHKNETTSIVLRKLDGKDISIDLFVTTFLGYGTNEARRRHVELLTGIPNEFNSPEIPVIEDPCLQKGLFVQAKAKPVVLMGTGNLDKCIIQASKLLNKDAHCAVEPCLFNGVHFPETKFDGMDFLGVSEYWYSSHDVLGLGGVWDMLKFIDKSNGFCSLPWSTTKDLHLKLPGVTEERLRMQCFKAAWLISILHEGFGLFPKYSSYSELLLREKETKTLSSSNNSKLHSVNKIGSKEASWTLGAMLIKITNSIPVGTDTLESKIPGIILPNSIQLNNNVQDQELADSSVFALNFNSLDALYKGFSAKVHHRNMVIIVCILIIAVFLGVYKRNLRLKLFRKVKNIVYFTFNKSASQRRYRAGTTYVLPLVNVQNNRFENIFR
ncbi:hypothetical protein BB559_007562 [Furculomyces boomerangus]|uniref:Uncharacterized protein n=1 Tax=Furculomyces boomerangus TaxID=61424 RepID=A0A2T9XWV9_9FUNG|nr:hypothetical protein BB559_007562 [Furculomyces boomerangus]